MGLFGGRPKPKDESYTENYDMPLALPSADMQSAKTLGRSPTHPEFWRHYGHDGLIYEPLTASESIDFEESLKDINKG
jgi:hypothetical protein